VATLFEHAVSEQESHRNLWPLSHSISYRLFGYEARLSNFSMDFPTGA